MEQIPITTEYIRLDSFLKLTGMVDTGGQAKVIIQDGQVKVNGEVCPMRGKKLYPGDKVSLGDREFQTVQAG
ncbi:s4 region YaaA [Clostridium sp. CAG:1013]|jgi:ribosome-associated protein|nr:s4 region YaaA [Clostridium sp. CAG:1013]